MSIKKVTIENFKNIKNFNADMQGQNMLLLAENGLGKSSFMQAIQLALGGSNLPAKPVTDGEEKGQVQVVADANGNEYTFTIKFDKTGRPKLEVVAPDGIKDTRKSVIGSIVGEVDFDLNKFVRLSESKAGKKEQVEIIKSFLPAELQEKLTKGAVTLKGKYDERTQANSEVKLIKGFLNEADLSPAEFESSKGIQKIDTEELQKKYDEAVEANQLVADQEREITIIAEAVEKAQNELALKQAALKAHEFTREAMTVINTIALRSELHVAGEHNLKFNTIEQYSTKITDLKNAEVKAEKLTTTIESFRDELAAAVKGAKMPVEGLTFTEDALLYNGHEVDINTLSTSEIMHLGIQLKMAKHPNIKVLFIENGESFGTQKLQELQKLCEEYGYQIIMEQVERGRDELTIEIMPKY